MLLNWDQQCTVENTVMNFRGSSLLISPSGTSFSRRTSIHGYRQFVISSLCSFWLPSVYFLLFQTDLLYLLTVQGC